MAQARGMDVISVDVKAAFLQGLPLTERIVTVTPPPEAKVPKGKLWQLRVALYGLDDASLRFHWKVRQVMKELNLRQSLYDPATKRTKPPYFCYCFNFGKFEVSDEISITVRFLVERVEVKDV